MIGLGWVAAASAAELWWVPDDAAAVALREALSVDWAEQPCQVVVGRRPAAAPGWSWDGETLSVRRDGTERLADADDAHVAVLFARSWQIRTETPGWEQWLPAGDEELLTEAIELSPIAPVRAGPDPDQTPWSLGIGVGTRTMTQVPSMMPSVRVPAELVVGSWFVATDLAVDPTPWEMGSAPGLVSGIQDLWSVSLRSGGRTRGTTWMAVSPGLQFRMASPALARDGSVVSAYDRPVFAGVADLALGQDLSFVRLAMHTWLRTSYSLPVSAGVDLEVLAFVHERRR